MQVSLHAFIQTSNLTRRSSSLTVAIIGLSENLVLIRVWALYAFNRRGAISCVIYVLTD
jgi:hypothetical protein